MKFEKQTFTNQEVRLDFNEFLGCHFDNCTLVYGGYGPSHMENNSVGNSRFELDGPAAETLDFISAIYHGMGDGGKSLVEATFDSIRTGNIPDIVSKTKH